MPRRVVLRLIAVETVEVAHSVRQIGRIERETIAGDEVLGVIVETEYTVVFGRVRTLKIERVDILGVLLAITIVIDIGQHTSLKTVVGIVRYRGQDTEVPTGLDLTPQRVHFLWLGLFLLGRHRQGYYGR